MSKMISPAALAPRRPLGFVRYVMVAVVVLFAFYTFSRHQNDGLLVPADSLTQAPNSELKSPISIEENSPPIEEIGVPVEEEARPAQESEQEQGQPEAQPPKADPASGGSSSTGAQGSVGPHPIDKLIFDAQNTFAELTSKESRTLEEATQAYRKRRNRHPPPGFDKWFEFASANDALIVEDFFDQIYQDLEPFWGLPPAVMRKESWDFEMTIHVRDGFANTSSTWFWTVIWEDMIESIENLLPDMDIALNPMDEPRLVVPWEDMAEYMKKASKTVGLAKPQEVVSKFQKLPKPGKGDLDIKTRPKEWTDIKPYWPIARRGCAPDSGARNTPLQESFEQSPIIDNKHAEPHMFEGYVSNYTLSTDICHQPDLQGLEGILIAPLSTSATKVLYPLFGGSKLNVNNEILLPAPMYWNEEERFTGGDDHGIPWNEKEDAVIWRGVATGGKNRADNWKGFQRHRFVAMNNGTKVSRVEAGLEEPENFALPAEKYHLRAQEDGSLGDWIDSWANVSFIDLMCYPQQAGGQCNYTGHYFKTTEGLKMAHQFDYKYLPDIDGNSFSGRYLGFLRSTSLPIKSTIWREWHDSRLVPWKHFVPMDSRYGDFYGIMEYFLGLEDSPGHDAAAEKIATEGKDWADRVLRKEDMQIYTLRLLLEYARLLDDKREKLGYVDDVLANPALEKAWADWK